VPSAFHDTTLVEPQRSMSDLVWLRRRSPTWAF
jgi:hypothetical protein